MERAGREGQKSRYVEGPGITRFWLKVKNRNYQRKEPVEFRTRGGE
jgi:hypothetical protein